MKVCGRMFVCRVYLGLQRAHDGRSDGFSRSPIPDIGAGAGHIADEPQPDQPVMSSALLRAMVKLGGMRYVLPVVSR